MAAGTGAIAMAELLDIAGDAGSRKLEGAKGYGIYILAGYVNTRVVGGARSVSMNTIVVLADFSAILILTGSIVVTTYVKGRMITASGIV